MATVKVTVSNRGGDKLALDGYLYVRKKTRKNEIRWICSHSRSKSCKGALTTNIMKENPRNYREHTHPADPDHVQAIAIRMAMKAEARATGSSPAQILAKYRAQVSEGVGLKMGLVDTVKRDLRRHRRVGALDRYHSVAVASSMVKLERPSWGEFPETTEGFILPDEQPPLPLPAGQNENGKQQEVRSQSASHSSPQSTQREPSSELVAPNTGDTHFRTYVERRLDDLTTEIRSTFETFNSRLDTLVPSHQPALADSLHQPSGSGAIQDADFGASHQSWSQEYYQVTPHPLSANSYPALAWSHSERSTVSQIPTIDLELEDLRTCDNANVDASTPNKSSSHTESHEHSEVPKDSNMFKSFFKKVRDAIVSSNFGQARDAHELQHLMWYGHVWENLPSAGRNQIWERLQLFELVARYGWNAALKMMPFSVRGCTDFMDPSLPM